MEYLAAYKILNLNNKAVNLQNLKALFTAINATFDESVANDLINKVSNKSCEELVQEGLKKMTTSQVSAVVVKEEKVEKKEEKVEKKEDESVSLNFDLFD